MTTITNTSVGITLGCILALLLHSCVYVDQSTLGDGCEQNEVGIKGIVIIKSQCDNE